ncbi:MAG TPA: hypothetical protein DIU15_20075 [Deltaproteobacteria bacterium]|nr:hypothetical protein [Deltaproteobacteria bacterium]
MAYRLAWMFALGLLLQAPSIGAAPDGPELNALIERISLALGGQDGGEAVLSKAKNYTFTFRRTIKDAPSGRQVTADHRYLFHHGGKRARLDIRIRSGKGKDSATVLLGDEAWLLAEGEKHAVNPETASGRLGEFTPQWLFSVPLALATEGRALLGGASLSLVGRVREGGSDRFILVGTGDDGEESARLEIDARTYRPVEIAFRSSGGNVVYRYGDYREVERGLIVPFRREFLRNGIEVSSTEVFQLELSKMGDERLFDPEVVELPDLSRKSP